MKAIFLAVVSRPGAKIAADASIMRSNLSLTKEASRAYCKLTQELKACGAESRARDLHAVIFSGLLAKDGCVFLRASSSACDHSWHHVALSQILHSPTPTNLPHGLSLRRTHLWFPERPNIRFLFSPGPTPALWCRWHHVICP